MLSSILFLYYMGTSVCIGYYLYKDNRIFTDGINDLKNYIVSENIHIPESIELNDIKKF